MHSTAKRMLGVSIAVTLFLYWADAEGILRMPIGGGPISRLARTPTASQIGLDADNVYFNGGVAGSLLFRKPKGGLSPTLEVIASSTVTDLYVQETETQTTLYWSEASGAVRSYAIGDSTPITYQIAFPNRFATSVTASAVVSNGETPYRYSWGIDNGTFIVLNDARTPDMHIYAALAACDTAEGTLLVTVTDAIGRSASASAEVSFTALRPQSRVCD